MPHFSYNQLQTEIEEDLKVQLDLLYEDFRDYVRRRCRIDLVKGRKITFVDIMAYYEDRDFIFETSDGIEVAPSKVNELMQIITTKLVKEIKGEFPGGAKVYIAEIPLFKSSSSSSILSSKKYELYPEIEEIYEEDEIKEEDEEKDECVESYAQQLCLDIYHTKDFQRRCILY